MPQLRSIDVGERLRLGIVGCGDVAHRHYLPGIASRADRVAIAAVADPNLDAAGRRRVGDRRVVARRQDLRQRR